jgi:O-acetyl-ADP-ribose deacetylase (regulator of RNase III)
MIRYHEGDVTRPIGSGPRIVAHCCNDVGRFGAGVASAITKRWPLAQAQYLRWSQRELGGAALALGAVQLVRVDTALWIANIIGQSGVARLDDPRVPIRYDALRTGLGKLCDAALARSASVHMPRIGMGYAKGDWAVIEPLITETLVAGGVEVTVYTRRK